MRIENHNSYNGLIKPKIPRTILIVEDDAAIRELLALSLVNEGYEVLTAPNGKIGLECLWQNNVDLIILDIQMPVMDGIEFKNVLDSHQEKKAIPIILYTGSQACIPATMKVAGVFDKTAPLPKILDHIKLQLFQRH